MTRRRRTSHREAAALSLLVACGQPAQPGRSTPVVEETRRDPALDLSRLLAADAVLHDKFARRTLYSWTTADQIDDLRTTKRLLVRDESPVSGASYVDQVLYLLSLRGDPVAQKIYTAPFAKMRFAWPSMWATRAGWPGEQYGDQLIRITLRPEAWIAYLSTSTGKLVVHDLADKLISDADVLAKPERLAAIYFVSDATAKAAPGIPRPTASFREYALCNESMIEWYEVGTARLAKEIDQAVALVESLVRWVITDKPVDDQPASTAWHAPMPGVLGAYRSAVALASVHYQLTEPVLRELVAKLRATPRPAGEAAIKGTPTTKFTLGPARKAPRIVRNFNYSFAQPVSATSARP